jgi:DNA-binding transcriptional ArsR family regulator
LNEENNVNYYAIIPATVRYDIKLKANEKLLYGEITALSNRNGYCYAQNRYFAKLYNVSQETVSRWLSHLQELGYIKTEVKRNEKKEIIARNIYIIDIPYCQKNQYPYCSKDQEGIDEKVKENNINNNIDDLFYLIINNSFKISNDFYSILNRLELIYTEEILQIMQPDKIQMLKEIIYVLYDLFNSNFDSLLSKVSRESLLNLYILSQEHRPDDLLNYYKRAIINKYTNNST